MRRVLSWGAIVIAALLLLAFAVSYPRIARLANVGAGYVALQMCSCVEVSERSYADCLPDMLPDMERIRSEHVSRNGLRGVRAWIPVYADRSAWRRPPDGCTLEE